MYAYIAIVYICTIRSAPWRYLESRTDLPIATYVAIGSYILALPYNKLTEMIMMKGM